MSETDKQTDEQTGAGDPAAAAKPPRHHLLIAGTGRAGTSFLVRYLTGLGLDTHLARHGDAAFWDEEANAGLEDLPLVADAAALPYVVKSPWLHEYVDQVLASEAIVVDAVIVPVRPLDEAAASRIVLELRAVHERLPWMAELARSWGHVAVAPGGGVFSLHPLDQARVLAVGFHRLVERVVRADVPLVLLDFPRLVSDPDYLFGKLAPILPLPPGTDAHTAREVHRGLADAAKVRIGGELAEAAGRSGAGGAEAAGDDPGGSNLAALDRIAIGRELVRLRGALAARSAEAETAAAERDRLRAELDRTTATPGPDAARAEADRRRAASGPPSGLLGRLARRLVW